MYLIFFAPHFFRISIVAEAEPPVANIGSSTRQMSTVGADGQAVVIGNRFQRALIAKQADVPHLRRGHHLPHAFHHAQPGAQHRHQADLFAQFVTVGRAHRRGHRVFLQLNIGGGFVGHQDRDFADEFAELLGLGIDVAQEGEFLLDERMLADVDVRHRHLLKKKVLARLYSREDESQTAGELQHPIDLWRFNATMLYSGAHSMHRIEFMSDLTHVEFLQQAYHDNWQQYLASLKPNAKLGWDVCVLTASDERQANMYRGQLEWRRTTNLLPAQTRFLVIADPDGQRIGSGGATLRVLAQLAREDDTLTSKRILIIHSGGDSRRLPHLLGHRQALCARAARAARWTRLHRLR